LASHDCTNCGSGSSQALGTANSAKLFFHRTCDAPGRRARAERRQRTRAAQVARRWDAATGGPGRRAAAPRRRGIAAPRRVRHAPRTRCAPAPPPGRGPTRAPGPRWRAPASPPWRSARRAARQPARWTPAPRGPGARVSGRGITSSAQARRRRHAESLAGRSTATYLRCGLDEQECRRQARHGDANTRSAAHRAALACTTAQGSWTAAQRRVEPERHNRKTQDAHCSARYGRRGHRRGLGRGTRALPRRDI
jgi:hypothetical protein